LKINLIEKNFFEITNKFKRTKAVFFNKEKILTKEKIRIEKTNV